MVQEKPFIIGFQVLVYYLVSGKNQEHFSKTTFPWTADMLGVHMTS